MDSIAIDKKKIYTIGYSAFEIDKFISTLKLYGVTAISDVRSSPYSKFKPDYNREYLSKRLKENSIQYVFLGDNLGGSYDSRAFGYIPSKKVVAKVIFPKKKLLKKGSINRG